MSKILIADDSSFQRKLLTDMIETIGHEVVAVESGQDLINELGNNHYDCVCLDLLMPGMTGIEVLEKLQNEPGVPPIIVVSADIQVKKKERCMELGAAAFINKATKREELEKHFNIVIKS